MFVSNSEQLTSVVQDGVTVWWIMTYSMGIREYSTSVGTLPPHVDLETIVGHTAGKSPV